MAVIQQRGLYYTEKWRHIDYQRSYSESKDYCLNYITVWIKSRQFVQILLNDQWLQDTR